MMGKVVSDSQKDWDLQLPFVMAAYRSTVHASTNFTPNYLMMAREVRAPADLVFGTPVDQPPVSYDSILLMWKTDSSRPMPWSVSIWV